MIKPIHNWHLGVTAAMILLLTASTGYANVIYSNGPPSGQINAFSVDVGVGYAVSDSFVLSSAATVNEIDFTAWLDTGATATSIDWLVTQSEFSGTVFGHGTASLANSYLFNNGSADIYNESFAGLNLNLAAGTYWLQLENGITSNLYGNMWWDENDGPSAAFQSLDQTLAGAFSLLNFNFPDSLGTGSETFQIVNPEPATFILVAPAFLLLATLATRRARTQLPKTPGL